MILIDMNQVVVSAMFAEARGKPVFDENLLRHMVLNTIRLIKIKNKLTYGSEIVLCYDGKDTWRKDYFPFYKANRKKNREDSDFDWNAFFSFMASLRDDIRTFFPYHVMHLDKCEGDDIIAVLAKQAAKKKEKCLIVSSDGDFDQLLYNEVHIDRYNTFTKELVDKSCIETIWKHIAEGDSGDGIPNILSDDDVFVNPTKRQSPMTKKRYAELFVTGKAEITDVLLRNIARNAALIDFTYIPSSIQQQIETVYELERQRVVGNPTDIMGYLAAKKMTILLSHASEF